MEWAWLGGVAGALLALWLLAQRSAQVRFLLKFGYLYTAYTAASAVVCLVFCWRPRHRNNAVILASCMQCIHRLVPLEFRVEGGELLRQPGAAVILLNHQSALDLMALFELWPLLGHAGPVAKQELLFFQPFGLACWLIGTEFIKRGSRSSHEHMNLIGARAKKSSKKIIIFPEGTRNSTKGLSMLPFKKGAFHLAVSERIPLQPVVISEYEFLDMKRWIFNPGVVTIKVLPRIETAEFSSAESMDNLISLTRDGMLTELRNLAMKNARN